MEPTLLVGSQLPDDKEPVDAILNAGVELASDTSDVDDEASNEKEPLKINTDYNRFETASVSTVGGGVSDMRQLFGEHFHTLIGGSTTVDGRVVDPELLDSHSSVQNLFGAFVDERGLDVSSWETQQFHKLIKESIADDARADIESLFGPHGVDSIRAVEGVQREGDETKYIPGFGILHATIPQTPEIPLRSTSASSMWLVDLPKVDPNRQILHADPMPYRRNSVPLMSTDRRLYTTQNVVRWTVQKGRPLSNARVVRWSDGSCTLHVGTDVFEIAVSTENALCLLAVPNELHKAGIRTDAYTNVVGYDEHVVVRPCDAGSVNEALVKENIAHRSTDVERRVSIASGVPLPRFDSSKPKKDRSMIEEWVFQEREKRRKEMEERARLGKPMTMAEQFEAEQKMMETLQNAASIEELRHEQERLSMSAMHHRSSADRRRASVHEDQYDTQDHGNLESLYESINNSNSGNTSNKRAREEDGEEEEEHVTLKAHRHEGQNADAQSIDTSTVLANLETLYDTLPSREGSDDTRSFIRSLLDDVNSPLRKGTPSAVVAELKQIVRDIRDAYGQEFDLSLLAGFGVL